MTTSPTPSMPQAYIVAIPKFLVMIHLSLGFYFFYWFYQHWLIQRGQRGLKPVALLCSVAGPLLIYPLMKRITERSRMAGQPTDITPLNVALMFWLPYALALIWELVGPAPSSAALPLSITLLVPVMLMAVCWIIPIVALVHVQQAANTCAGDELGRANARITGANRLWIYASWLPIVPLIDLMAKHMG